MTRLAQKDWTTDKWYFIVWADEQRTRERFRSKPIYAEEEDASAAALAWRPRKPAPTNFSWGEPARR